jgi:hypothetical protein
MPNAPKWPLTFKISHWPSDQESKNPFSVFTYIFFVAFVHRTQFYSCDVRFRNSLYVLYKGREFMSTVSARLTHTHKTGNKRSFVLLQWFSGTTHTLTGKNIGWNASLASCSQPGVVTQLVEVYARRQSAALSEVLDPVSSITVYNG